MVPGREEPLLAADSQSATDEPAATRNSQATPSRWRDILVLGYSHAGQHAYVAGVGIAIPFVVSTFHVSYAYVGLLLAIATVTGSLLQALAGMVKRTSTRLLLVLQNLGSTAGALVGAVAPGIGVFFAGRLLQSWATWPQHPIAAAYLSARHPRHRGSVLSWHVTAGNVGTLVAPLAVTAVIAADGWRWGFVLLAVLFASTAVAVAIGLPGSWRPSPRPQIEPGDPPAPGWRAGLAQSWTEFVLLARQRPVASLLLAGTIAAGGQGLGVLTVYMPGYLRSELGFSAFRLGAVMTVVYIGAVIGPVLMGSVSDRVGHRGILLINYVLGALSLVAFASGVRGVALLGALALAVGIFSYSELSLRQTAFSDYLSDDTQRSGFGLFFAISQSIGSVWVAIIGLIVTEVGFFAAYMTMAGSFLLAAFVVLVGTRPAVART